MTDTRSSGGYEKSGVVVDLFAGPGGWSQGARSLGLRDIGIEWDEAACLTRRAAGHLTIRADVAAYPVEPFMKGRVRGLIASPPCQDFSLAGKGAGLAGDRGQLVWQALRWALLLTPTWIAFEQVPPVLPIWKSVAHALQMQHGYRTWVGILNAADYGVPQTRKRAFLLAHRSRPVAPPAPTHTRDGGADDLFGGSLPSWITMAEALGWGMVRPATAVTNSAGRGLAGGSNSRKAMHDDREAGRWVVRTGANSMKHSRTGSKRGEGGVVAYERDIDEPAPTLDAKVGSAWKIEPAQEWALDRPATTVVGSFCPDIIAAPGYRTTVSRQNAEGSVRVTEAEAGILQSFPADYPWQGSKTKRFEQIGNAVPPLLAAHVLSSVTGLALPTEAAA